ncbi:MAG: hypothetical protein RH949_16540 [Coleofasciculus sp. A1-SPW-01]|uniref:hypothetical protein n=1 Tax=Coleofasciculus sp. A1-SPW-01 TaxID=3070819 RepID=UPI0032F33EC2
MTTSATAIKFILTPVALSAAVFATLTLPLNLFGSKPVTVQVQEEPLFFGELKDFAPQYLGVAGLLSAGVGLTSVAMMGWQQSNRKSAVVEQKLAQLTQTLDEKQKLLDNIRSSQSQLDASGLQNWLDKQATELTSTTVNQDTQTPAPVNAMEQDTPEIEEVSLQTALEEQISSPANSAPVDVIETPPPVEPQVMSEQPITSAQVNSMQALAASLASAQAVFGNTPPQDAQPSSPTTSEVERIDHQLEQMMAQIVSMRQALQSNQYTVQNTVEEDSKRHHGLKLVS